MNAEQTLKELRALLASDAHAITFQSLLTYRVAMVEFIDMQTKTALPALIEKELG